MIANLLPWRCQQRRRHILYSLITWLGGLGVLTLTSLWPCYQQQQSLRTLNQDIRTLHQQIMTQKARNNLKPIHKKPTPFNHASHLIALLQLLEQHSPNLQITQLQSHPPHWQLQGQSHNWPAIQSLMHDLTTQTYQPTLALHAKATQLHFTLRGQWPQPSTKEIHHG